MQTEDCEVIQREEESGMSKNQVWAVYAAYSLDETERVNSSSGGIFSLLARRILSDDGVVYGVAMSEDCLRAEFVKVTDKAVLDRLRTSKYLQAHVGDTFRSVKEDLENGLTVLFSGTGCQINGLIGYLGVGKCASAVKVQYPNLYCIDVICHGAPSPALWREYVEYIEKENGAKLIGINFRCKDNSWTDFGMKETHSQDGIEKRKELYISKDKDPYMLMFLRDYCLRPSCYECKAKETKLSDITLADFWGIQKIAPEMSDGKGTSLVLVRTDKGAKLLQQIAGKVKIKEVSYEDGVASNRAEYMSASKPAQRDIFFDDMRTLSFDEMKKKYGTPTPVPLKRKIKLRIKKILIRAGIIRGGINSSYGLLFVFRNEK